MGVFLGQKTRVKGMPPTLRIFQKRGFNPLSYSTLNFLTSCISISMPSRFLPDISLT